MKRSTIAEATKRRAGLFGALADPARLAILDELARQPRCPCELEVSLGLRSNLLAYHLRILREAGLVTGSHRGRRTSYALAPQGLAWLEQAALSWHPHGSGGTGLRRAQGAGRQRQTSA
jgi:ArsR family transcriptional regulator